MATSASTDTSEVRVVHAIQPEAPARLVARRRNGHEYYVDHHGGEFWIRTNDKGKNFRLVRAPLLDPAPRNWKQVLPHRKAVMMEDVDLFKGFWVATERDDGVPRLRVTEFATGRHHHIDMPEAVYSTGPGTNVEFTRTSCASSTRATSRRAPRTTTTWPGARGNYQRKLNRERFVATVESLEEDGIEPVYDVTVTDLHAFDANGLYVHNCAEQPLPPYGCCCLGSIDLTRYVKYPFASEAEFDFEGFGKTIPTAVRMLDNVLELTAWPLEKQHAEAMAKRRVGLGYTGLGDTLVMLGLRYNTHEARAFAGKVSEFMRDSAYRASCELASEDRGFSFDSQRSFRYTLCVFSAADQQQSRQKRTLKTSASYRLSLRRRSLMSSTKSATWKRHFPNEKSGLHLFPEFEMRAKAVSAELFQVSTVSEARRTLIRVVESAQGMSTPVNRL